MRRVAVLLAIFAVAGFGVLVSTAVAGHSCHGGNPWCSPTTGTTTPPTTTAPAATTTASQSTTTAQTTTSPTTTTTPAPSGSVLFDGRAANLTGLASHEVCSTCGYNLGPTTWPDGSKHYWYQSTASDPWRPWDSTNIDHGCFCFMNDDISLSADALFGKVYKASVKVGDVSPWHGNTGGTVNGAGQLSKQRPNDIGQWDYFAIATKVPSWNGPLPTFFDFASLGYETFANDQLALGLRNDSGVLSYSIIGNAGYINQTSSTQSTNGDAKHIDILMPVTFGQWDEWVLAVKWSCGTDGQLQAYHRVPGGSWSKVYERLNQPTLLWGTTVNYGSRSYNGTWHVMDKIGEYYALGGAVATETSYQSGLTRSSDLATAESTLP